MARATCGWGGCVGNGEGGGASTRHLRTLKLTPSHGPTHPSLCAWCTLSRDSRNPPLDCASFSLPFCSPQRLFAVWCVWRMLRSESAQCTAAAAARQRLSVHIPRQKNSGQSSGCGQVGLSGPFGRYFHTSIQPIQPIAHSLPHPTAAGLCCHVATCDPAGASPSSARLGGHPPRSHTSIRHADIVAQSPLIALNRARESWGIFARKP